MDNKTGKEGQGVKGSGFEGRTGSNSYSALPKSSNAELGIDADVCAGRSEAVSNTNYGSAQNVGAKEGQSSRAKLGYDEPWAKGTVGATENMGGYGPTADDRGEFGTSAKSGGHAEMGPSIYGSGARVKGTASESGGAPGQTGSMAMARKGLGGSGGPSFKGQTRGPLSTDRGKSQKGLSTKSQVGNN